MDTLCPPHRKSTAEFEHMIGLYLARGHSDLLAKVVVIQSVTTKINRQGLSVDFGHWLNSENQEVNLTSWSKCATLQAMSLYIQRLETAIPGVTGNCRFCLLGSIPNPLNRPLRWSGCAAFLPLSGHRPLLILSFDRIPAQSEMACAGFFICAKQRN